MSDLFFGNFTPKEIKRFIIAAHINQINSWIYYYIDVLGFSDLAWLKPITIVLENTHSYTECLEI